MASLALTLVGSAIGGALLPSGISIGAATISGAAIGGAIGGALGGIIDQMFLFPALFGESTHMQGPRLDDLSFQTASEGSPMHRIYGPQNRTAGTVIWLPEFMEEAKTEEHGDGKAESEVTSFSYFADVAVGVCDNEVRRIRKIWADSKLIFDIDSRGVGDTAFLEEQGLDPTDPANIDVAMAEYVGKDARAEAVRIYRGTADQEADSRIQAKEGIARTPAYRHLCYVVFQKLALADFGNRVPQFSFEVEHAEQTTVAEVISTILSNAGLDSSYYDVSEVRGCVRGYILSGPQVPIAAIEPLLLAHDIGVQEVNGKLKFFNRTNAESRDVVVADLASYDSGDDPPRRPFVLSDPADFDLPASISVSHLDPERRYQEGSQRASRIDASVRSTRSITMPMTLSASEALYVAKRILWRAWAERLKVECHLPPSYATLAEGTVIRVVYEDEQYDIRVDQVDIGYNYLTVVKGVVQDARAAEGLDSDELDDITDGDTDLGGGNDGIYIPSPVELHVLDIPALRTGHETQPGLYFAGGLINPDAIWRGAVAFVSPDDVHYDPMGALTAEVTMGETVDVLSPGTPYYWDRENTVEVILDHGTLQSVDEYDVLQGQNAMMIGDEIIGFANATLVSEGRYILDTLLRGLRNTESAMETHRVQDRVILLNSLVQWTPRDLTEVGVEKYYKAVATYDLVDNAEGETLTFEGNTLKPFSPCHVQGVRDSSNNLTISWVRRTRALTKLLSTTGIPLLANEERYEVDIVRNGLVVRTLSVTGDTQVEYSAINQDLDNFTAGDPIDVVIYQVTDTIGRGFPAEATV